MAERVANSTVFNPLQNGADVDANNVTKYGFHIFAAAPTINFPTETDGRIRLMFVYGYESRIVQVLITPSKGLMQTRQFMDTWSEWVQV